MREVYKMGRWSASGDWQNYELHLQVWIPLWLIKLNIICYFLQRIVLHQHLALEYILRQRWKVLWSRQEQSIPQFCSVCYFLPNANKHYIVSVSTNASSTEQTASVTVHFCFTLITVVYLFTLIQCPPLSHLPTSTTQPYPPLRNTLIWLWFSQ